MESSAFRNGELSATTRIIFTPGQLAGFVVVLLALLAGYLDLRIKVDGVPQLKDDVTKIERRLVVIEGRMARRH